MIDANLMLALQYITEELEELAGCETPAISKARKCLEKHMLRGLRMGENLPSPYQPRRMSRRKGE